NAEAAGLILQLVVGGGAGQEEQEVAVLGARNEDLAAVDDVLVALLNGARLEAGRLRPGVRLGDAEGLQAQLAAGDGRQIGLLLILGAVLEDRAHGVHLGVGGGGIAAGVIDLLQDDGRLGDAQAGALVLGRDERAQPAGLG